MTDPILSLLAQISALGWCVESMGEFIVDHTQPPYPRRWHVCLQRIDSEGIWIVPAQYADDPASALALALTAIPLAFHRSFAREASIASASTPIDLVALGLTPSHPPPPTFALSKRFVK